MIVAANSGAAMARSDQGLGAAALQFRNALNVGQKVEVFIILVLAAFAFSK